MILERDKLREQLMDLKKHQYMLDEENDAAFYLSSLLYYIGDPDPSLRDDLIYETFAHWIETEKYLEEEELSKLLLQLSSAEYLGKGLFNCSLNDVEAGQNDFDTPKGGYALTRAFSALVIACIIRRHNEESFLSEDELKATSNQLLEVLECENDFRGYVQPYGWVHAIAHYADVMEALLKNVEVEEAYAKSFMKAVSRLYARADAILGAQEEERLINGLYNALFVSGVVSTEDLRAWLFDLGSMSFMGLDEGHDPFAESFRRVNKKLFLRALYFRGMKRNMDESILDLIYWLEYDLVKFK